MGKFTPRNYVVGIIIFTFFIVGGVAMIMDITKDNPSLRDAEKFGKFNSTFNKYNNITGYGDDLRGSIEDSDSSNNEWGVAGSLLLGAWNTLKLMFGSLSFMTSVFGGLYDVFSIPRWVGSLLITLVTIMIAFAIFSAIFQRDV